MNDDDDPVALYLQGEHDGAARALRRRYGAFVHGVMLAHAPLSLVEELTEETLDWAGVKLGSVREPAALPAWLAMSARRRAIDARRRRDAGDASLDDRPEPADRRSEGRAAATIEAREAIEAVRALPEAYRETLILRLVEGLSGPEIAARTGLTPGSVRVNLHRGLTLLRAKLEGAPAHD